MLMANRAEPRSKISCAAEERALGCHDLLTVSKEKLNWIQIVEIRVLGFGVLGFLGSRVRDPVEYPLHSAPKAMERKNLILLPPSLSMLS